MLVARVCAYNDPDGLALVPGAVDRYWLASVRLEQLPGRWATAEEAMAAAEQAHDARPKG